MLQNTSSYPSLLAVATHNNGTFVFSMERLFAAYNGSIITMTPCLITWDIDISISIQKTQLVVQRLLSCLQFL